MIYDIDMPREDFEQANELVKGLAKNFKPRELVRITQDDRMLPYAARFYLAKNPASVGVTFLDRDTDKFDIWLSPAYQKWTNGFVLDTVLHELTHGYTGAMVHGQTFRRMHIKALHLYDTTIAPIPADRLAWKTIKRYSKDSLKTQRLERDFAKKEALGA